MCTSWLEHENRFFLIEVFRQRLEYPALKRQVLVAAQMHAADVVLIEDNGSGTSLIQDLRREGPVSPIGILAGGDKITRMSAQSAKIEADYMQLPECAPWLQDFRTEILQFSHGRHDDQVDSLSQFLGWVSRPRAEPFIRGL